MVLKNYINTGMIPAQMGVAWDNQVYRFTTSSNYPKDSLAKYLYNGQESTPSAVSGYSTTDWANTAAGQGFADASDAFLPPLDYGDAPASFDPAGSDPASHDYDSTIKLGTNWNPEFAKKTSNTANTDNSDDGVTVLPVFTHSQNYYNVQAKVYNHSGQPVTAIAWIDFNDNGVLKVLKQPL